jgi:glycosyltransferase involved in cell wall biosynthesis
MRNLKRIVYTSSYDRGLEHLLEVWPDVKKAVPDATLDCYYGWQLFQEFYKDNPASMKWKAKMEELLKQDGVTDHGRIPQQELEKEMRESGIWAYPTHFGEINCISGLKSQAYGCEPVVVNYAALKETVQYGRKVEGDIYDEETKEEFKKQLIEALLHPMTKNKRYEMMDWAKDKYSWSRVADQWIEEFRDNETV